ncbi:ArsR/SmtB family transcription factor [Nocardia sp. IBHARD005]|uniref:ArsR/SmtB family transcription factor n=1 Tax=Nocardia sp. IBHARD005 TaxID=3457765 RepID=UPI004059C323
MFEALADSVRRDLLVRLAGAPARVVDLAAEYPISRPAISKHLRALADAGLVRAEPHGRERHYRLAPAGLTPLHNYLARLQPAGTPIPEHALDGLDLEVRRTTRERRATTSTDSDKEQTA